MEPIYYTIFARKISLLFRIVSNRHSRNIKPAIRIKATQDPMVSG